MNTTTKATRLLGAAALFSLAGALAGCAADDEADAAMTTSQSFSGGVETAVWKAVPTKPHAEVAVHAEHAYAGELAAKCGAGYAIDLVVDFGTVTSDTLGVDAVTAFYLPRAGGSVVPLRLRTWSKHDQVADAAIDGSPRGPGEHARYEVKAEYRLDPDAPFVALELETAGSLAPSDPACRAMARFVFYPVIPR